MRPLAWRKIGVCTYGIQYAKFIGTSQTEEIRVLVNKEPVTDEGVLLHVSCSVGIWGQVGAIRRCTDEELEQARKEFIPPHIDYEELPNQGQNPFVRHLWEMQTHK